MSLKINFSSVIQVATNGNRSISVQGTRNLNELIQVLIKEYGNPFKTRILENGKPREYINIYVNGVDIRFLDNLDTKLISGDEIDFIPAVSGG